VLVLQVLQDLMCMQSIRYFSASKVKLDPIFLAELLHVLDVHLHSVFAVVVLLALAPFVLVLAGGTEVRVELVWCEIECEGHGGGRVG